MNKIDFNAAPAEAFTFRADAKMLSDKGDTKTVKVELLARTGQPINHWYWGRIVHDLSGMIHKSRMPIDYAHNDSEVLGYVNKFKTDSGDLVLNGVLTPFKDDDRASEVIHKARAGVPYQASIFFGGNDDLYELVSEDEFTKVNGFDFNGPGIVVRKWRLNGVAICPYGADGNTETNVFAKGGGTRRITLTEKGESKMKVTEFKKTAQNLFKKAKGFRGKLKMKFSEDAEIAEEIKDATEVVEEAAEAIEDVLEKLEEAVEQLEVTSEELEETSEDKDGDDAEKDEEKDDELKAKRAEFSKIKKEFGAEIAAQIFERGEGYADALKLAYDQQKKTIAGLEKRVAESKENAGGSAAKFSGDVERKPVDAWKAAQKKN